MASTDGRPRARGEEVMEAENTIAQPAENDVREVVGLFNTLDSLQSAIDELLTNGFDRSDISLLAEAEAAGEREDSKSTVELGDTPAQRTPYIESESLNEGKASLIGLFFYIGAIFGASAMWAAGRSFAESIFGGVFVAVIAALGAVALTKMIGQRQTKWVRSQLERGGLLLWARAWDHNRERAAIDIMERNGGHDVHGHSAA